MADLLRTRDKLAEGTKLRIAKIQDGPENPDISPLSGESKFTVSMNWIFADIQNNHNKHEYTQSTISKYIVIQNNHIQSSNIQLYRQLIICSHGRRNRGVWGTMPPPTLLGPGGTGGTGAVQ